MNSFAQAGRCKWARYNVLLFLLFLAFCVTTVNFDLLSVGTSFELSGESTMELSGTEEFTDDAEGEAGASGTGGAGTAGAPGTGGVSQGLFFAVP
jgi:hypothetical protein